MATWKSIFPIPHDAGKPDLDAVLDAAVLDSYEILDIQARLRGYVAVTNTDIVPVEYGVNGSGAGWFRRAWDDGGTFVNLAAEWAKRQGLILEPPPRTPWTGGSLLTADFPEIRWAVPKLLAEGLAILGGRGKSGKSWLSLDLAVAIGLGDNALGNIPCEQGAVLVIALEDPPRRLAQRLRAILQGRAGPKNVEFFTEWPRMDEGGLDDLKRWLAHHKSTRLVVIDLWARFCPEREKGEDIYRGDYKALTPLKQLADEFHVAILLLHHENKMGQMSGTTAMTGAPDTILTLKREAGSTHGILAVEGREVESEDLAMEFNTETGQWTRIGQENDFRKSEARRNIIRVLGVIDPLTAPQVSEALGKPRNNGAIRQLLFQMHKDGEICKNSDAGYTRFA